MLVAVPCEDNNGLKSRISPHFGRAKYFAFVEVKDNKITNCYVIETPFKSHGPGDLPNFIKSQGASIVLAYGMGPRAVSFFNSLGIKVITGIVAESVEDAVMDFLRGTLNINADWASEIQHDKA